MTERLENDSRSSSKRKRDSDESTASSDSGTTQENEMGVIQQVLVTEAEQKLNKLNIDEELDDDACSDASEKLRADALGLNE